MKLASTTATEAKKCFLGLLVRKAIKFYNVKTVSPPMVKQFNKRSSFLYLHMGTGQPAYWVVAAVTFSKFLNSSTTVRKKEKVLHLQWDWIVFLDILGFSEVCESYFQTPMLHLWGLLKERLKSKPVIVHSFQESFSNIMLQWRVQCMKTDNVNQGNATWSFWGNLKSCVCVLWSDGHSWGTWQTWRPSRLFTGPKRKGK